ncbi:MAG: hypothetical protein JJU28_23350 [Cyclobacteriaceae bacterium]|nr:hypothetical protein [Cyclobacteriaceae bacterium]
MQNTKFIIWLSLVSLSIYFLSTVLTSCTSLFDNEDPEAGFRYYPFTQGLYRVYDVMYIQYRQGNNHDTIRYELKEQITGTFTNLEGNQSFRIERFKRFRASDSWLLDSVLTAHRDNRRVIVNENNIPKIKLSLPVAVNTAWNTNALNGLGEEIHEITAASQPFELSANLQFPSTIKISINDVQDNLLFRDVRYLYNAQDVGKILQEVVILNYCAQSECVGQFIIESGIAYRKRLKEYGTE